MPATIANTTENEPTRFLPSPYGLTVTARQITETDPHWEDGYRFEPRFGGAATSIRRDCDDFGTDLPAPREDPIDGEIETRPVMLTIGDYRRSVGMVDEAFARNVETAAEQQTSKVLEAEFWTGAAADNIAGGGSVGDSPNQRLATSTVIVPTAGALAPKIALAELEMSLAAAPGGGRGVIHMTRALATVLADWLTKDSNRLVTKASGSYVIVGDGYPGTAPAGQAAVNAGEQWLLATGEVVFRLGDVHVYPDTATGARRLANEIEGGAFNQRTNSLLYRAARHMAANYDPIVGVRGVLVDLDG